MKGEPMARNNRRLLILTEPSSPARRGSHRPSETLDRTYPRRPDHMAKWLPSCGDNRRRFRFDERVGAFRLRLTMRVARSPDGRSAICVPASLAVRWFFPWMTFAVEPEGSGTLFTHRINLRLGPLARLLDRSLVAPLRRHMQEEAVALQRLTAPPTAA
jgi:hypothetical protein